MSAAPDSMPVVLVTGTTSGIGYATVRRFAAAGWRVVATTRRDGNPFADLSDVVMVKLDQSDPASIGPAIDAAALAFGRIDRLVNNAGYCLMGPLAATDMEQIRRQYETNVFGLIAVLREALPHLQKTRGGVINIASISADNGYPFGSVYSSTKAAVAALTEGLNVELSQVEVFAKAVLPGFIATDIFQKLDWPAEIPAAYADLLSRFMEMHGGVKGYSPDLVADTIFTAATDGKSDKVRYYPTPDARSVPFAKRLLGQDAYWRMFRRALLDGPGKLQRMLAPFGSHDVRIVRPAFMRDDGPAATQEASMSKARRTCSACPVRG